jgi:hypothetical protein
MSTTQIVAWWGAILATVVFIWDIYKWAATGPRLVLTVKVDMKVLGDAEMEDSTYIISEVANVGDRATTLTLMAFEWYRKWWQRLLRKPVKQFFVKNPGRHSSFPHKLDVGDTWNGFARQDEEQSKLMREGYLYCAVYCSSQKRPVSRRAKIATTSRSPKAGDAG